MTHAGIEPTESTYFAVMLVCRNNTNVVVAMKLSAPPLTSSKTS